MIIEFEIFESASVSGGKVWGYPKDSHRATMAVFGKLDRFRKGMVTVRETAQFDVNDKSNEKTRDGYAKVGVKWINTNTGEVLKNYTPPKTAKDIVDSNVSLIEQEDLVSNTPLRGLGNGISPFTNW